jgi:hypothetical protein
MTYESYQIPHTGNVEILEVDIEILCPQRTWESDESSEDESDYSTKRKTKS